MRVWRSFNQPMVTSPTFSVGVPGAKRAGKRVVAFKSKLTLSKLQDIRSQHDSVVGGVRYKVHSALFNQRTTASRSEEDQDQYCLRAERVGSWL